MSDTPNGTFTFEHMFGKLWGKSKVIHNFGYSAQNVRAASYGSSVG